MSRTSYAPLYVGLGLLISSAIGGALESTGRSSLVVPHILFWVIVHAITLRVGWSLRARPLATLEPIANVLAVVALCACLVIAALTEVEQGLLLLPIALQAARNLVLRARRDLALCYVLSLVLILYGASQAKETHFLLWLLAYVLSGVFTLMADQVDARLAQASVADESPQHRSARLLTAGAGVMASILLSAALIYLATPQPRSPRLGAVPAYGGRGTDYEDQTWRNEARRPGKRPPTGERDRTATAEARQAKRRPDQGGQEGEASSEYSGFKPRFDVREVDRMALSEAVVLYLRAERSLYLRVRVFDSFDGRVWSDAGRAAQKLLNERGSFEIGPPETGTKVTQAFSIANDLGPFLPAAYRPVRLIFPATAVERRDDLVLRIPRELRRGTAYGVISECQEVDGHPYGREAPKSARDPQYLELPEGLSTRVVALAQDVARDAGDGYQSAVALERSLRTDYSYSLETVGRAADTPVETFLFETRRGHCELFASSLTVMLRALGVPARLVTGFRATRLNPVTGYYEVQARDAHAWVEAHVEPYGWVTLEPTAPMRLPGMRRSSFIPTDLKRYVESRVAESQPTQSPFRYVVARLLSAAEHLWDRVWKLAKGGAAFAGRTARALGLRAVLIVLAVVGSLTGLLLARGRGAALRRRRRLRLASSRGQPDSVILCYRAMEAELARLRFPRAPGTTPSEYARSASRRYPPVAPALATLTGLFEDARYGARPPSVQESVRAFGAYETIRQHLARSQGPVERQRG